MAYKFQIGEARLSGSIVAEEGLTADEDSRIIASGSSSEIVLRDNAVNDVFKVDFANNEGRIQIFDNAGNSTFIADDAELSSSYDIKAGGDIVLTPNASVGIDTDTDLMTLNSASIAVRGEIQLDKITSLVNSEGLDIDGSNADNATFNVLMKDNVADAFNIKEGSVSYLKFVTTNGSEAVVFGKDIEVTALSASGQITAGNFDADGSGNFGTVTTDTTIVAGTTVSGGGQLQGASVAVDGVVTAGGVVTGNSLVTAGNIGLSADADLISLTANTASVNGQLTISGDLIVLGDTISASVGELLVEDNNITVGDGSAAADGQGLTFGSTGTTHLLQISDSVTRLSSSLAIKAPAFHGDGSNLTGVTATASGYTLRSLDLNTIANGGTITLSGGETGVYGTQSDHTASFTVNLGASFSSGDVVIIKSNNSGSDYPITVEPDSGEVIDGEPSVVLESTYAAITLIYDGMSGWNIL